MCSSAWHHGLPTRVRGGVRGRVRPLLGGIFTVVWNIIECFGNYWLSGLGGCCVLKWGFIWGRGLGFLGSFHFVYIYFITKIYGFYFYSLNKKNQISSLYTYRCVIWRRKLILDTSQVPDYEGSERMYQGFWSFYKNIKNKNNRWIILFTE